MGCNCGGAPSPSAGARSAATGAPAGAGPAAVEWEVTLPGGAVIRYTTEAEAIAATARGGGIRTVPKR